MQPAEFDEITTNQALTLWEKNLRQRLAITGTPAQNTIETYRRDVIEMIERTRSGDRCIDSITNEDISDALEEIAAAPDRRYTQHMKNQPGRSLHSRARWVASCRAFFNWAVSQNYVQVSPMTGVAITHPKKTGARTGLTVKEVQKVRRLVHGDGTSQPRKSRTPLRDYALLRLLSESGPRVSEVVALNLTDIVEANTDVQDDLEKGQSPWLAVIHQAKGRKSRRIPVGAETKRAIDDYIEHERPKVDQEALFLSAISKQRLNARDIQRLVKKVTREAAVSGVTPHGLRHTALSEMSRNGAPLGSIMLIAGHSSPAVTAVYLDPSDTEAIRALDTSPLVGGED